MDGRGFITWSLMLVEYVGLLVLAMLNNQIRIDHAIATYLTS